ncbi:MAG: type II toxin-antitoxin system RelE/ParE family toxin [Deltaproteobacteria bacterium]|nr:type II toxin-antitoxin system RelE/ParE family toxin [Deltaproteobacteria bacterium]
MSYNLEFKESALKEWWKIDRPVREQFKKKLSARLENPKVGADKVSGLADTYKIKLRASGLRLVYTVDDEKKTLIVYAVGKRDKEEAYRKARARILR